MKYAKGALALGTCDRCALTWPLKQLRFEYRNRFLTSLRVCPDCLDIDHEQLRTDTLRTMDAISLRDARPDAGVVASRAFVGFNPVTGAVAETLQGTPKVVIT